MTTFALIELDGMVDVNADLGVLGSDELIVAVAKRLQEALPAEAVCGRIGSDEFAVTLTGGSDLDAEAVIHALLESIARPHWIDTVVRVSAHAGFAQTPRHATTRGELTRRAELALRAAAKKGPGAIVAFELAIDTSRPTRNSSSASCRARSAPMSWNCITSRSSPRKAAALSASKPCCAGPMPRAGRSGRRSSYRSPSRWA